MNTTASTIVSFLWLIFVVYWIISGVQSKRTVRSSGWWMGALIRVGTLIVIGIIAGSVGVKIGTLANNATSGGPLPWVGVVLCGLGIGFAIWARRHIGKNWGMPMSLKENPELVTSGPYRFVRHPIYTGALTAMLGSTLTIGTIWLVVFIVSLVYFMYSAKKEEQIMAKEFPDVYPEYKKRTKMIIPFVL